MLNFYKLRTNYRLLSANSEWHTVNTCAVRLADAMARADPKFFVGRPRPVDAGGLAAILHQKLGKPAEILSRHFLAGRRGVIFFESIQGFSGTGHISLWDWDAVVDGVAPFERSFRVRFWQL